MPNTTDAANSYEVVLADLKAKREEIDRAIELIERLAGSSRVEVDPSYVPRSERTQQELAADSFFGMSIPDGVKKFLRIAKKPQSAGVIAKALEDGGFQHTSKNFYSTVFTVLSRLQSRGEMVKVGKDWGLVEWYPGFRKTKTAQSATSEVALENVEDEADGEK